MLAMTILSIFIFIILLIIFIEYKNEKKYQRKRNSVTKSKRNLKIKKIVPTPSRRLEEIVAPEATPKPPIKEVQKKTKNLPKVKYPQFSHARLLDMGLSNEESIEFVQELIPQLEMQIPLIEEVMNIPDFRQMERLTHSIKGSTTNIGTGGVSDLLVECNTYLKSGTDIDIAKIYFEALKYYTKELREEYI